MSQLSLIQIINWYHAYQYIFTVHVVVHIVRDAITVLRSLYDEWRSNNNTVKIIYTPAIFLNPSNQEGISRLMGAPYPNEESGIEN